jgi:hypothetical protein
VAVGAADWVAVGVVVGDVDGCGVEVVAVLATLCDGVRAGVELELVAVLAHPAASVATSISAAIFGNVTVSKHNVTRYDQARTKGRCVMARNL